MTSTRRFRTFGAPEWLAQRMEATLDYLAGRAWIAQVFMIVLATLVARYVAKLIFDRLARQAKKTRNLYDDALLEAARGPLGSSIYVLGIAWAAEAAGARTEGDVFNLVGPVREVAIIALLAWFALRFVRFLESHVSDAEYVKVPMDATTATAIGKLVRAAIVITAFLVALQTLGFSITGVLAFGGVGGIAVGFAARDLLANFFGGLMIYMDRPFAVGEWIRSSDREIEGTVEEIGWRLTRIRTFDQRPLFVPNSVFTSLAVENPSRMSNRRIYETIGVRYADLGALKAIVDDVRSMVQAHPEIDVSRTLMVNFVSFGESALNFFVYAFTKTTAWEAFHEIKEDVLFRIAAIIEEHGAEVAFPTQTLLLENAPDAA